MQAVTWFWIGVGLALCLLELIFPTALVELVMGLSALLMAFASLVIPSFGLQIFLWLVVSLLSLYVVRRLSPRQVPKILDEPTEATTLTAIAPGERGRVLYEGSPWAARCQNQSMTIAPQSTVIVVGREGTTLVVMPSHMPSDTAGSTYVNPEGGNP
jgi:membrane protein implicated in regulation of membrane protease activity